MFTLHDFCTHATQFYSRQRYREFLRLVLTGEYSYETDVDSDETHQVFLDPLQNIKGDINDLNISRDYDSAIGIAGKILVDAPITIYTVPHPTFALSSSVHFFRTLVYKRVDHHKYNRPHQVTKEKRALWYEKGLRPAIVNLLGPQIGSQWPATYQTEEIRAKNQEVGGMNPDLDPEDRGWTSNFLIMHTIRGVKHASFHQPDQDSASFYLDDFFKDAQLSNEVPNIGEWYVDVGIEISSVAGECLQWVSGSHSYLIQEALEIDQDNALHITSLGSSKYARDLASHLPEVSGFRIEPGKRAEGPYHAVYVQAYTTDKSVVYNVTNKRHAKYLTTHEAMTAKHPTPTIDGLHDIYDHAKKSNSSNARLEVRVPACFADKVLLHLDSVVIQESLCAFDRIDWWSFRIVCLMAISQVLDLQSSGSSSLRFRPEALILLAGCVWLLNGLHARPDDGPASRDLMDAILPITDSRDVNPSILAYKTCTGHERHRLIPWIPFGCIFFRRIITNEVPRLRYGGNLLPDKSFRYFFKGLGQEEVKMKSRPVLYVTPPEQEGADPPLFHLNEQGFRLASPAFDDGSDREDAPQQAANDIDQRLSNVWRQFVLDLKAKSPSPKGITRPSYVKIDDMERKSASEALFQTLHFSRVFTDVYYKQSSPKEWQTSFKWFFPLPGYKASTSVQYKQVNYYGMWMDLMEENQTDPDII
ncbi:hypothetical protein AN958_03744 [Leucoagaricus sp. SymC.cos]|nr:hypothetical protein AN958_03744 [Leucoagaricus sp. SymC.cos]